MTRDDLHLEDAVPRYTSPMASTKRNTHGWTVRTADGQKREVRAHLFGKRWTFKTQLRGEDEWTDLEEPELDDLYALYEVVMNKYRRKHMAWDHVQHVIDRITEMGGSVEEAEG